MKEVAAYLLAVLGGNTSPTVHDLKAILGSVGADADDDMLELLLSNVKGKDLSELIASGKEMMASSLSGCGGGGVGGGAVEVKIAEKVEEKKEEKAAEEDEEFDDDFNMGSIFD